VQLAANIAAGFVGLLHVWIFVLEAFLWTRPKGRAAFRTTAEFAASTKVLAANQGVYNAFLAAGCFIGLALGDAGHVLLLFSLACVLVAGLVGGLTASREILMVQALPGAVALALVLLAG
jgi:putative membrane protein